MIRINEDQSILPPKVHLAFRSHPDTSVSTQSTGESEELTSGSRLDTT